MRVIRHPHNLAKLLQGDVRRADMQVGKKSNLHAAKCWTQRGLYLIASNENAGGFEIERPKGQNDAYNKQPKEEDPQTGEHQQIVRDR